MSDDFLSHCVAKTTGNPMLDRIRDRSADVVLAVFRLLKNAMVHSVDNDAVKQTAQSTAEILGGFAGEVGSAAMITFIEDSTFVCGQLLRASRAVYESAAELGRILGRVGVSECSFEAGVTQADLLAMCAALGTAIRDGDRKNALLEAKIPNVSIRKVDSKLTKRSREDDRPSFEKIVQFYATALVVMRGFYGDIAQGLTILPHRVKRLAQRFVVLAESEDPAVLGMSAMARAHRDDAGRAVQTAILALAVARQITKDRIVLAQLVMAALLADVGRARVLGPAHGDALVPLSDADDARVPSSAALACVSTGGVNPSNAARTATVVEVAWLERRGVLGEPWSGTLPPIVPAQILGMVRDMLARVAPRDTTTPMSPADALEAVAASKVDRILLRLLVRAVGLVPAGTVVELDTGEWAVAVGPSKTMPHLPELRVVTDRSGRALEHPRPLDLGQTQLTFRVLEPDRARFNVTRAFGS